MHPPLPWGQPPAPRPRWAPSTSRVLRQALPLELLLLNFCCVWEKNNGKHFTSEVAPVVGINDSLTLARIYLK